ncbi:MAG: glutathione S-transferase family protein [Gammaproteobacteria bacterium]
MIKLYGIALSNYTNMVKLTLEEKGIAYQEISTMPNQESDFKARSPMGKVPCIETEKGCLAETAAILEYLEEVQPTPRFLPTEPFARAKTREVMRIVELYVELAARRHFQHVFFGGPLNQAAFDEVKPAMEVGLSALTQLTSRKPFLCGAEMTYADIYAYHSFPYANMVTTQLYKWDIIAAVPGLKEALAAVGARAASKKVDADQQAALAEFMAQKK